MSHSEEELRAMLAEAARMPYGEGQTSLMEDVVRHADAAGLHRLAFRARRELASAYSVDRQWNKAFPLFSRCLSEYDSRPGEFGPEEDYALRRWYTSIAQSMAEFPEISLDQIYGAFEDMERRFRAGGHNLSRVHAARRWVAQVSRDWAEEERCYQQWKAAGGPSPHSVWDFEAEVERLVLRGDDASVTKALDLATPVLAGEVTFDEPAAPIQCLMLLPLVRAGRFEEAATAFHRSRRAMHQGVYRYDYSAMTIEFCALTGNEKAGLTALRETLAGYVTLNRPNGKMEYATAGALLCRQLIAAGRAHEPVKANGSDLTWSVVALQQEMENTARALAAAFDQRNGTTHQGDGIRARLAATPVVDFLPLSPTDRRPDRSLAPPVGAPPEVLIDRAEWHHAREETDLARACLAVVGTPPPHLAPRHAMLTALTERKGDEVEPRLLWAAEAFRQAGDLRRHLLCRSWLGSWLAENGRVGDGLRAAAWAAHELTKTGDRHAIATAELEHARAQVAARQDAIAYQAIARAAEHALAAGDPVQIGAIALVEARWRDYDRFPPARVLALASVARDAFAAARSPGQQVGAYEQLRRTHRRAGTAEEFNAMVERDLQALAPDTPGQLRGYLRYRRGLALVEAGRTAEALDDLIDAVGESRSRDDDTAEQGHYLAVAYRAAGRVEDAVQTADEVAAWLDVSREYGILDDPQIADANRLLLAEGYTALKEFPPALDEYDTVATGAAERGDPKMVMVARIESASLLDRLDRDAEAARAYRAAGDAAAELRDAHTVAACRAGEALSLHWAGEGDRALAVLTEAEKATKKVPKKPADQLAASRAITANSAAHVLAGQGRFKEATDRAAEAADLYRSVGNTVDAVKMDLLRGRLLARESPDLAVEVLRGALAAAGTAPLRRLVAQTLAAVLDDLGRPDEAEALRAAEPA